MKQLNGSTTITYTDPFSITRLTSATATLTDLSSRIRTRGRTDFSGVRQECASYVQTLISDVNVVGEGLARRDGFVNGMHKALAFVSNMNRPSAMPVGDYWILQKHIQFVAQELLMRVRLARMCHERAHVASGQLVNYTQQYDEAQSMNGTLDAWQRWAQLECDGERASAVDWANVRTQFDNVRYATAAVTATLLTVMQRMYLNGAQVSSGHIGP